MDEDELENPTTGTSVNVITYPAGYSSGGGSGGSGSRTSGGSGSPTVTLNSPGQNITNIKTLDETLQEAYSGNLKAPFEINVGGNTKTTTKTTGVPVGKEGVVYPEVEIPQYIRKPGLNPYGTPIKKVNLDHADTSGISAPDGAPARIVPKTKTNAGSQTETQTETQPQTKVQPDTKTQTKTKTDEEQKQKRRKFREPGGWEFNPGSEGVVIRELN
jgi:hypothetical protein